LPSVDEELDMTDKKAVSRETFNKRVDIERAHLEWIDRLTTDEALQEARKRVSAEYRVDERLQYPD